MSHVGMKEILGVEYEVHADARSGQFRIIEPDADGRSVTLGSGDKLETAVANARTALNKRKVKVAVRFRDLSGKHGTAYGIHGRSRKVLARLDDGTAEQYASYSWVFKDETPDAVVARYNEIADEKKALKREEAEIERKWKLDNIGTHVTRAIDEAVKGSA